jgi:hypothetical protein
VIIDNVRSVGYFKSRPAPHKLEGITTRQHSGIVLTAYPKDYPLTSQQKKVRDAARSCGIHTGISRSALVKAMTECIPGKF